MNTKRLRDVPLFATLGRREFKAVTQVLDELDVGPGQALTREGEPGREFFVIDSGRAEVTRDGEHVADLGPGDFFGEIALIEEGRRTATVSASEPTNVLVLTAAAFRGLRHTAPSVYEQVREVIASRQPAVPS